MLILYYIQDDSLIIKHLLIRQVLTIFIFMFQNILFYAFLKLYDVFIFSPFYLIVKPLLTIRLLLYIRLKLKL
jgi:hypothetical protein